METRFDEIAKVFASGLSRREVFRRVAGIVLGGLAAGIGFSGGALAQDDDGDRPDSPSPCCQPLRVCVTTSGRVCCPPGTFYAPVAGTNGGKCCPRDQVMYVVNPTGGFSITGCCPDGLVFNAATGKCGNPQRGDAVRHDQLGHPRLLPAGLRLPAGPERYEGLL
jgi:hypothetical protein